MNKDIDTQKRIEEYKVYIANQEDLIEADMFRDLSKQEELFINLLVKLDLVPNHEFCIDSFMAGRLYERIESSKNKPQRIEIIMEKEIKEEDLRCDACYAIHRKNNPVEASEEVLRAYPKTNIIDLVSCFEHVLKLNYLEEGTFDLCDIEFKRTEGEIDFKIKFTGN
jgi:hypothetical protein